MRNIRRERDLLIQERAAHHQAFGDALAAADAISHSEDPEKFIAVARYNAARGAMDAADAKDTELWFAIQRKTAELEVDIEN